MIEDRVKELNAHLLKQEEIMCKFANSRKSAPSILSGDAEIIL